MIRRTGSAYIYLPYRVAPAGSGFNREVHPITPMILGAYYPAGEKRSGDEND
jgi:hypothetical protein